MTIQTSRRGFLRGASTLLAAPALVRVASIMPVHAAKDLAIFEIWPARFDAGALNIIDWGEAARQFAEIHGMPLEWLRP